ncbi:hypothetical protein ASG87_14320 [Frateuria sp. Soil773]|uniref:hypothetical protein n=1 Tax=Frateuria sp. Soil773 TaxID=1736407 RepID=UPI0007148FB2|nr:hypothetical protein [Frateuria sp. Soil773]KRE98568.1 hypothetical protein ASG87_14320 [Frateuria sp. Soil773]
MKKISYGGTFFFKVAFPCFWFVFLAVFMFVGAFAHGRQSAIFVIEPALMMALGFFLFRKLVWNLADEVSDGGSFLLVRKGPVKQRVPLANVMNVSMSQFTNPRRLTLRLRTPCAFGDEIAFIPRLPLFRLNPFARNEVAEDLIRRVDAVRQENRA